MDDLKNHEHGDEGVGSTHSTCNKHNIGGKSVCCECSGKTDCSDVPMTPQWIEEFEKNFENLFDGEESIYEELKHFISQLLQSEKQSSYEEGKFEGMKAHDNFCDTNQALTQQLEEVVKELERWRDMDISCEETGEQHSMPENDCPGWSKEATRNRRVVLEQLIYHFKTKITTNK